MIACLKCDAITFLFACVWVGRGFRCSPRACLTFCLKPAISLGEQNHRHVRGGARNSWNSSPRRAEGVRATGGLHKASTSEHGSLDIEQRKTPADFIGCLASRCFK